MSFRNVVINNRCKLEYSLNYLVCRKGIEEKRILINEIKTLIINSTQVAITTRLISELSKNKTKIIFCDELHNPECELVSYQNNYYSYRKIKEQIAFDKNHCSHLWKMIIKEKIKNQAKNLELKVLENSRNMLLQYYDEVQDDDITNREGHSAKVYFNALFGTGFSRDTDNSINKYLNYGYSIILSNINREIKALGYLTELGIHHIGESNSFNLSCDFIEPLRPLVDSIVITNQVNDENFKSVFINMLSKLVIFNGKKIFLDNAIHLYITNLIDYLRDGNECDIKFIDYEL